MDPETDPLALLTYDALKDRVGESFTDTEAGVDLELVEVTDTTALARNVPDAQRAPFSLLFRGPREPALAQSIRPLSHGDLGDLAMFLVPVALEEDGMRYQAVFS
jgi:hypothetical protein